MSTELAPLSYSFQNMERLASAIAKSGLFGMKTTEQALVLMSIAQAEGIHPALAARDYHIIQGKPSLTAAAKLSRFQASGGKIEWHSSNDTQASATFTHPCSPQPITIEWNLEKAKRAELLKNPTWIKYPANMLRARVISDGVGATHPHSGGGLYTPEEVQDMIDISPPKNNSAQVSANNDKKLAASESSSFFNVEDFKLIVSQCVDVREINSLYHANVADINTHPQKETIIAHCSAIKEKLLAGKESNDSQSIA